MLKKKAVQAKSGKTTKRRTQLSEEAEYIEFIKHRLQLVENGEKMWSLEQVKKRFKKWLE